MKRVERIERAADWAILGVTTAIAAAGIGGYFIGRQSVPEQPKHIDRMSNVMSMSSHRTRDIYTDMDFDGKLDLRDVILPGVGRTLYFKKGYGPGGLVSDAKVEFVEPEYFDGANRAFHESMVKFAYDAGRE
ncbi:MAG: hypothetical protein ABH864_06805 [archaeon]